MKSAVLVRGNFKITVLVKLARSTTESDRKGIGAPCLDYENVLGGNQLVNLIKPRQKRTELQS